MILPAPENLKPWARFPLTWTLTLLNVLIFVLIFSGTNNEEYNQKKVLENESVQVAGRLYFQYLQTLSPEFLFAKPEWVLHLKASNAEQMETLGMFAIRDADFLKQAETMSFKGDAVRIESWKSELKDFKSYYFNQSVFQFGLYTFDRPLAWLTYQFSHSGWIHLFSNMVFLIALGTAVEALAGSGMLLVIYLLGGAFGGLAFLLLNAHGSVPMIGASASVSALLAFYCVVEPRKRVRFLYFISPIPGHNGFIYLPTLLIFPLFLLVDFASLLSTPDGLASGVAYSAHVGGTLFGLIFGLGFFFYRGWSQSQALTKSS